jgi:hypothetical protein
MPPGSRESSRFGGPDLAPSWLVIDIPPGMTTAERVDWIAARMAKLKIGPHHR